MIKRRYSQNKRIIRFKKKSYKKGKTKNKVRNKKGQSKKGGAYESGGASGPDPSSPTPSSGKRSAPHGFESPPHIRPPHVKGATWSETGSGRSSVVVTMECARVHLDIIKLPPRVTAQTGQGFYEAVEQYIIGYYPFIEGKLRIKGEGVSIVDAWDNVNDCFIDIKVVQQIDTGRSASTSKGQYNCLRREVVDGDGRFTLDDKVNIGYYLLCRKNPSGVPGSYLVEVLYAKDQDSTLASPADKSGSAQQYVSNLHKKYPNRFTLK